MNFFYVRISRVAAIVIAVFFCTLLANAQTANFTINNASQCRAGHSFYFTNTSSAGATAYLWNFGDGTTSTSTDPTKSYTFPGTYSVQLKATYSGIDYYVNKTVEVNPMPNCSFTYTASTMNGFSYTFVSTTTIGSGTLSYSWDFGDGGTSTLVNPTHTYAANGSYVVQLLTTSDKGCTCSIAQNVVVSVSSGGVAPALSFATNNISQCLSGNSFSFTNTSTAIGATYSWNFGDGSTSAAANPSHSYASAGTYVVKLIADISGTLYYKSQIVTVSTAPTASIAAGTYCTGSPMSVTTSANNVASIQWKNGASIVGTNIPTWSSSYTTVAGTSAGTPNTYPNTVGASVYALSDPYSVYLDASKNMYIIDNGLSRVVKWAPGASSGTIVASDVQITGLGIDKDGSLYTADDIGNHVLRWNVGATSGVVVAGGNGLGSAANQLRRPGGHIFIDNSYNVYITDEQNHRVQKWALGATSGVTVAGGNGSGNAANQLYYPKSIYVDAAGNIYVSDNANARIQYWANGASTGVTVAGGNGAGVNDNQFYNPRAIYVDAYGTMYIVDHYYSGNNLIKRWEAGATSGSTILSTPGAPAALSEPGGYFDVTTGCIYIPKVAEDIIAQFCTYSTSTSFTPTTAGSYTAVVNTFGACSSVTSNAVTVNATPVVAAITGASNICVGSNTTFANTTLGGTWSSSNTGIATVNSSGVVAGVSAGTATITYTVNNSGCVASVTKDIVVNTLPNVSISGGGTCASTLTANISGGVASSLVWSLNGIPVDTVYPTYNANAVTVAGTGVAGSLSSQLNNNTGVFVDAFGNTYVSDYVNNRVQKFAAGSTVGVTVAGGNGYGSALNQLNGPKNIFVDGNGYLYVADGSYNRVLKFPPNSTSATNGIVVATATAPFGIFVDAAGSVYVADAANYQVQRWDVGAMSGVTVAGGNGGGNAANQLSQPWGVYVDAAANVYVADAPNYRIQKWASGATTGVTVAGGIPGPPDNAHLSYVTGVYVDALGSVYTLDYFNRVMRWEQGAATGTVLFGSNYSGGSGASELYNPAAFAFTPNGDVYVSDGGNNRVQKFSIASLANTFTPTSAGNYCASAVSFAGCSSSNCTTVSSLGVVPTISIVAGSGCQTTICSGTSITFNSSITNGGASPTIQWKVNGSNVATGASFTTTSLNNNDVVTAVLTSNAACPNPNPVTSNSITINVNPLPSATISGSNCVGSPLTLTGSGIAGSTISWLLGGSPVGTSIPTFATNATTVGGGLLAGSGANELRNPHGIFVDANTNSLYVTDLDNYRVQKLSIGSLFGTTIAGTGTYSSCNLNEIQQGYGIFVAKNGDVYIADANCHRIVKWAPYATVGVVVAGIGTGGSYGSSPSHLFYPKSVYVDDCGNIYVADTYNHRIQKFPPGSTAGTAATTVAGTGVNGNSSSQLSYPTHVQVDAQGNIYVADDGNARVQKFASGSLTATTVAGGNGAGNANNQLNEPWGIFVDGAGNIYVADTYNNRVMYWANGATTGVKVAGTGSYGNGANGLNYPTRVFVDANGNLYVADSHNNRVQQFAYTGLSSFSPSSTGSYTAVVTNANGCSVTTGAVNVTTCTVVTPPSPAFTVNNANQCITGNSFVFTNTTSPTPVGTTYLWNFGDGTTSTATNPTKVYSSAGTYNVQMIATYNGQQYYANSMSVVVGAVPIASFTQYFNSSLTYTFNSTSTVSSGYITSYAWNFGDGGTATTSNPQHSFASAGTYNVTLTVTTNAGCTATITNAVVASTTSGGGGTGTNPSPTFTVNTANQCIIGNSFIFTNTTSPAPVGTTYSWNFGDGTTSTATNPTKVYSSAGTYNVQMIATYNGQQYYANSMSVVVGAVPTASFTQYFNSSLTYTFNSTSTVSSGSIASYNWNFGDGVTATTSNPQHTFASAGTYNVTLTVTTNTGCTATITNAVVISTGSGGGGSTTPSPSFAVNTANQCITGNSFVFTNTTSPAPSGTTYLWQFGDGTTSTATSPTHTYTTAGYYYVQMIATYNGQNYYASGMSVVVGAKPNVAFYYTGGTGAGSAYTFYNQSTINNGSMSYNWNFGDGGTSTLVSPSHVFAGAGTYNVKLVVTSDLGCKDSLTLPVVVCPTLITAFGINSASTCLTGNYFGVINYSSNNAAAPMTYLWNYGDGFTSTLQNPPTHTYASAGTYTITLTTTLAYAGCTTQSSSYNLPATVNPMPVANFNISGSPLVQCYTSSNSYLFSNTSTISSGSVGYKWDFGDTTYSTLYSPSHSYTHAGYNNYYDPNYGEIPIKLIATSSNNCKDSITKVVTLYRVPTISDLILNAYYGNANYPLYNGPIYFAHASYIDDTIQCFNQRNWFGHNVTANFTSPADNVVYNFGDATSYTGLCCGISHSSPYKYYTAAGNYTESAYVVSNKGCVSNTVYNKVILTPNTDTLPHSVIGLHPIITTNVGIDPFLSHSYDHYKINYASLSTTACRPIVKAEWTVTMVGGNPYHNHGTQVYQFNSNAPATADSAYFAFDVDTSMMPTVNITLITTNDLGMNDTAHATLGATNSGYTNYRVAQHVPTASIAVYPNPTTTVVNVAVKLEKNTNAILYIYNSMGQLVQQSRQYVLGGVTQNINANVSQLPSGVYHILLKDVSNNLIGKKSFIKAVH